MESRLNRLTKKSKAHVAMIDKQGEQLEKLMDMVAGLVHDIQDTKDLQAYQFDPEAYKQLTGRERPAILDDLQEEPPVTNKEEDTTVAKQVEQGPAPEKNEEEKKKEVRKKRKMDPKDQKDAPEDSKRSQKKK